MQDDTFELINDDEPGSMAPRVIRPIREDLTVAGQPAILASVQPPFTGGAWGASESEIILVSRTRDVSIHDMTARDFEHRRRVHVLRYKGAAPEIPTELSREDVSIQFWGLLRRPR